MLPRDLPDDPELLRKLADEAAGFASYLQSLYDAWAEASRLRQQWRESRMQPGPGARIIEPLFKSAWSHLKSRLTDPPPPCPFLRGFLEPQLLSGPQRIIESYLSTDSDPSEGLRALSVQIDAAKSAYQSIRLHANMSKHEPDREQKPVTGWPPRALEDERPLAPLAFEERVTIDPATKSIVVDGQPYRVNQPAAFAIAEVLFQAAGRVVPSREFNRHAACRSRPDKTIRNVLRPIFGPMIASKPGVGYWIALEK